VTTEDGFATWTVPNVPLIPGPNVLTIALDTMSPAAVPTVIQWVIYRVTPSNLMNYALNLDPNTFDPAKQPQLVSQIENGVARPTFVYSRRAESQGLAYVVEVSENLTDWRTATSQEVEALNPPVANADGVTETVSLRIKPGPPSRFVRLAVSVR